jgi:hypothetical protein
MTASAAWLRRHILLVCLIGAVMLAALPILTYPLGRDQGEFAVLGRGLLQGDAPYVDLWNPKPPAVFVVYALAMSIFGQTAPGLRGIDLVMAPILLTAVYAIGTRLASDPRRSRRAGLFAALLTGVFYFTESFWTLTQNDGIALVPLTLTVLFALQAAERDRHAWLVAFAAGLACGVAFWFKYPFLAQAITAVGTYLILRRSIRWQDAGAFGTAILAVVAGGAWILAQADALDALIESARVTSSYTALGFNLQDFSAALQTALGYRWAQWGLLFMLALAGAIVIVIHARRITSSTLPPKVHANRAGHAILLWLLVGAVIMASQAKAYDYHWLPMLPPLALLGACGLDGILAALGDRSRRAEQIASWASGFALIAALAVVVWVRAWPFVSGQQSQLAYFSGFQAGEFVASESLEAAQFLREHVMPGDSLTIWGFRPEIYFLSALQPATRFIFQFPLVAPWYPEAWREEHVDTLWAALPPYVIVAQIDYMPWVTGSEEDSNTLLQSYEEMNDWLIYNYEPDVQIGNLFVWRRKTQT